MKGSWHEYLPSLLATWGKGKKNLHATGTGKLVHQPHGCAKKCGQDKKRLALKYWSRIHASLLIKLESERYLVNESVLAGNFSVAPGLPLVAGLHSRPHLMQSPNLQCRQFSSQLSQTFLAPRSRLYCPPMCSVASTNTILAC